MQQSREARLPKRREHAGQDATVKQANSGKSIVSKDEQQNANEHNGRKKPRENHKQKRAQETTPAKSTAHENDSR